MKKEILFKEDVRKKMFTGLETVYNAVSATLGPRGHGLQGYLSGVLLHLLLITDWPSVL